MTEGYAKGYVGSLMRAMDECFSNKRVTDPELITGKQGNTLNMRMIRYVASWAWAVQTHKPAAKIQARKKRLLEYFELQEQVGMQSIDPTGGLWGYGSEQLTSSHHEQWTAGVYGAIKLSRMLGDEEVERASTKWLAGQLYWWGQVDPTRSGRVIVACARAYDGKTPACERWGRNQDWSLYLGKPVAPSTQRLSAALPTSILVDLTKHGWKFPEPVACKLLVDITIATDGSVTTTEALDPLWTVKSGWNYTRYDASTGDKSLVKN